MTTNKQPKKKEVLMVTFGLAGGSFMALKNIAQIPHKDFRFTILGLGSYDKIPEGYTIHSIPYMRYDGLWGHLASKYSILGLLLQIPLYLTALWYMITKRPSIVVFNGLATMLPLLPLTKLLGLKIVLSFRSWWDHDRFRAIEPFVKFYCQYVDLSFVNSSGTKQNLAQIISEKKIKVVSHHAYPIFFETKDRQTLREKYRVEDKFVILYVGRIDEEKHCDFMIEVIKKLKNNNKIYFIFVGEGKLKQQIVKLQQTQSNVSYFGFITDAKELAKVYAIADILWSNADETYFARPAIEALASGTPLMIFRVPAIGEKIMLNVEVPDSMVPENIGWIIDHRCMTETLNLFQSLSQSDVAERKRKNARRYAEIYYSKDPNIRLINDFIRLAS